MPQPRRGLNPRGPVEIDLTRLSWAPGRPMLHNASVPPRTVPPLPGYIRLDAGGPTLDLELTGNVRPLQGDSGWIDIDRKGRVALTGWRGGTGLRLAAPVLLDGTIADVDVDREWGVLERMARPPRGRPSPVLKISGAVPANRMDEPWVLDVFPEKDPETLLEVPASKGSWRMRCMRATTTLVLRQFVAPDAVGDDDDPPADPVAAAGRGVGRSVPVEAVESREGDTLKDVAKRVFDSARKWPELAKLNPELPRPPKALKEGTKVRVPPERWEPL